MEVKERIEKLRAAMTKNGIDIYIVPTSDCHDSEYVGPYFKCREYLTGFTGSAGIAAVTADDVCLWTDGRYFVQAAREIEGSGIQLMKMGEEGVPTLEEYLREKLPCHGVLGFDGRVVNGKQGEKLESCAMKKAGSVCCNLDLVGEIWEERPELSSRPIWLLDEKYAGETVQEKLARIEGELEKEGATAHIITVLDDIVWLLNIRGNDVPYNPVALSYFVMAGKRKLLFARKGAADRKVQESFASMGIEILPYEEIYSFAAGLRKEKILLDKGRVNMALLKTLDASNEIIDRPNPSSHMKAVKNSTEMENIRKAHIKDGIAVTRFMYWLKKNAGKIPMDEISAANHLEDLRKKQEGYLEPSFHTISAYGANGAMCHYSASEENYSRLEPKGFYLVDSGGQYYEGTTDITRTIALGEVTEEEKLHFTLTAIGMLRLGNAKFLYGCTGSNLDYIAREPFWQRGLDFKHGTGHGVGYLLNVHEGPNNIRWKQQPLSTGCILEEGMLTSDEPGIYIEGKHGIRTENLMFCCKGEKNEYGQFMEFEFVTFVPIDLDAIDLSIMEERDVKLLNAYHKKVWEKISPYLEGEEREWLKTYTREVKK